MVTQDAKTFVSLGQAVALARAEGAVDEETALDLSAALVAGVLSGCMDLGTYGRVHETLAALLEQAFAGPARDIEPSDEDGGEPLGAYLEVVDNAWEKVSGDDTACAELATFVARAFDLSDARFGNGCWFHGPLRLDLPALLRDARRAGLLVVAQEGTFSGRPARGCLRDPSSSAGPFRLVLGWGERRAALDVHPSKHP